MGYKKEMKNFFIFLSFIMTLIFVKIQDIALVNPLTTMIQCLSLEDFKEYQPFCYNLSFLLSNLNEHSVMS